MCTALVRWPPVGRKKHIPRVGKKPMGRNELIADYILLSTGEERDRKQVSSHIQVLKPFVQDEPDSKSTASLRLVLSDSLIISHVLPFQKASRKSKSARCQSCQTTSIDLLPYKISGPLRKCRTEAKVWYQSAKRPRSKIGGVQDVHANTGARSY